MSEKDQINKVLNSGPLKGVRCLQVNETLKEVKLENAFFVDAGIELIFPDGSITAAWNTEIESLIIGPFILEEVYQQENAHSISSGLLDCFIGKEVTDYTMIQRQYEMIEDDMMEVNEVEINIELNLIFANNTHLQIALVDYTLNDFVPSNFIYDLGADILVNGGNRIFVDE